MFRYAALLPECTDSRDVALEPLLQGTVCFRRELDDRMQRNLHPRRFLLRHVHVIRIDASQHRLVSHDDDIFAPLQLHDDGFKAYDNVSVAFATAIPVVVFVVIPGLEVFGIPLLDLGVGKTITNARVDLIQSLPFKLVVALG